MSWLSVPLSETLLLSGSGTWGNEPGVDQRTYPVLRSTNIRDGELIFDDVAWRAVSEKNATKYGLEPGDIIVTTSSGSLAHIGKTALFDINSAQKYLFSNFTWRLRPNKALIEPRFLYYYLNSSKANNELQRIQNTTSGLRNLDTSLYIIQAIPLPPLSEQKRIIEIVDQVYALRRKRSKADAKAQRILPALFVKMFGDPATNPMGWPVRPLHEFLSQVERRNPTGSPDEPFIYLDIAGVDGVAGRVVETKNLLGSEAPSRARQVLHAHDVVVSTVRPYLRATAMVTQHLDGQICSTGFCVLRSASRHGHGYLYALTRMPWFTDQLNARSRGASYPAVTDRDIWDLRVPIPDDPNLLSHADGVIEEVLLISNKQMKSTRRVEVLFDALLDRAFSGELTPKWRKAHVEELLRETEGQLRSLELAGLKMSGEPYHAT